MGVIRKQAIKSTILNYIGLGFGTMSRLIMPFILSPLQIGVLALIETISGTFTTFFNMGYNLILARMFPHFRDTKKGHHGFLMLGVLVSLLGITLALFIYFSFEELILKSKNENPLLFKFSFFIPFLIVCRILYLNLDGYVRLLYNSVSGIFIDGFLTKILLFSAIALLSFSIISYDAFVCMFAITLALPGLLITAIAFKNTQKLILPTSKVLSQKKMLSTYAVFGIFSGITGSVVNYMDQWMIHNMISLETVGVYSIISLATSLIIVPSKNVKRIAIAVVSDAWKTTNLHAIQEVYSKSSTVLLIIGFYLFLVGWSCITPVLSFLPEYSEGKYVFLWLGLGKVLDLGTGVNNEIISSSPKYKYNALIGILFAALIFVTNLIFIRLYGIVGAGLASFISIAFINFVRWLFLYKVLHLNPFNRSTVKTVLFSGVLFFLISITDYGVAPLLKIFINGVVVTLVFWSCVIYLDLSDDISSLLKRKNRSHQI